MIAQKFIAQFKIFSKERLKGGLGSASNSEIQRWCKAGNVVINAETVEWNEEIDFPIISVRLFPKGKVVTLR